MICRSLIFFSLLCVLNDSTFADWRGFRGSSNNGLPEQTIENWDGKLEIEWQVNLPGRGLSSPILVGDRIYVTCSSGPMQERLHILCFNQSDGQKIWQRNFWATGRTITNPRTCVAAPSPASDGKHIFAFYSSNDLICLDLEGNLLWFRGLSYDYPNASNSLGMASSALALNGKVVVMVETDDDSFATGIDAKTGETTWRIKRPERANWTSPVPTSDGKQILMQSSAGVSAIDVATGEEVWKYADGAATQPTLTVVGETAYVPSHGITAIRPGNSNADVPEIVWQVGNIRPGVASPIADGENLYVINSSGVMVGATLKDGQRLWQTRLGGKFSASPVMAGGKLVALNEDGTALVIDPNSKGEVVSTLEMNETMLGTPSVGSDGLYFRSDRHLYKITVD
ncbi:PQQ-binding-like beta-propeller repeat protein [Thalassoglobus sp.]|uniref:PQQ-like beta-propeller repeat protein n=1 Tax=Thalassoglobus sp. TaxID=2795869 RepID=UPI003AA9B2D1